MFAYCGNNPISRADFSGHAFVQHDFNYNDLPDTLFPELGGGAGGSAVAGGSMILSGLKYSADEDTREAYDAVIDLMASNDLDGVKESEGIQNLIAVFQVISGGSKIVNGFVTMFLPEPTPLAETVGYATIMWGLRSFSFGIEELFDGGDG